MALYDRVLEFISATRVAEREEDECKYHVLISYFNLIIVISHKFICILCLGYKMFQEMQGKINASVYTIIFNSRLKNK
jgi:hypothetical protein